MECQYKNCSNIGAMSCPNCGMFVCGAHFKHWRNHLFKVQQTGCSACHYASKRSQLFISSILLFILGIISIILGISSAVGWEIGGIFIICGALSFWRVYTRRTGFFLTRED